MFIIKPLVYRLLQSRDDVKKRANPTKIRLRRTITFINTKSRDHYSVFNNSLI